ncbi:MAG TPA: hypothetical protein VG736_10540 [Vicinamibacterales bacterium]|jgi:hypothetical protein|nr:hypothetical protein [Vicinamibacterales bacterium]
MNGIRVAISVLILALITLAILGWQWTGTHQPPAQYLAARAVLTIMSIAGLLGLGAIWRPRKI